MPTRAGAVLLALAIAASACAPNPTLGPTPSTTSAPTTARPTATPTATIRTSAAVVERVDTVAGGLVAPWAIDLATDGRLFVTERDGRIRVIKDGVLDPTPWATFTVVSRPNDESGLLGLALDAGFPANGFAYVYFTYAAANGRLQNRLVRLREQDGKGVVDKILLDGLAGGDIHDGGRVRIGPDGKLYVSVGDAGNDPLAQDLRSLNGKILRLERDGSVPVDNPIAGSPIWSYGHRNPQGLAWDARGRLFATEHGPSGNPALQQDCCHDEVNRIDPGVNYGWPIVFGIRGDPRFRDPLLESGTDTWAPSGATFITTGALAGSLLFAALRGTSLDRVVFADDGRTVLFQERLLAGQYGRLRDVLTMPDGTLLVLTSNRDGRGTPSPDDDRVLRVTLR
ncbi:MAG: PQQ-dependent sugar dehydrogenase [Chloroflexi bacterium]|nr:MAG: PQQ-dependent sugar dehydrogenase [Chloroflexota bacterium]